MATKAQWVVVFDDKTVIKNFAEGANEGIGYLISDDDFWGLSKWSNIWAIQYGTPNSSDTVEYRDDTSHSTWEDANLGDFTDFTTRWDSAHLAQLQSDWDNDNEEDETEANKVARLGSRPTSYSS
tara:strand:+ start:2072 stop:2446 length:375 start_codon:yes stop_codon:yes gene_type:complete